MLLLVRSRVRGSRLRPARPGCASDALAINLRPARGAVRLKTPMLIYPDTSDLIRLCRGTAWLDLSNLARRLAAQSHRVVFSMDTLIELADPLRKGQSLEVRRRLNQIEELPHLFVNEARIQDMEIREAVNAFEHGREYDFAAITPFASRLDEAIDIHRKPLYIVEGGRRVSTAMIVNFRMAEVIRYLWNHDPQTFDVQRRREREWIWMMEKDRAMTLPPSLPDHFVTMMSRALVKHGIPSPAAGVEPFARWVYESPSRCPGVRLAYEAHHQFRRDRGARPAASDIIDLGRIKSVPYVDFFVTDRPMMNYCKRASVEIGRPYQQLLGDLRGVMSHLGIG